MSFFRLPGDKKSIFTKKVVSLNTIFPDDNILKDLQINSAIKTLNRKKLKDVENRIKAIYPKSIKDMLSYWSTQPPILYNWMVDLFEELIENVIVQISSSSEGFVSDITNDQYNFWKNHMEPILASDGIFVELRKNGDKNIKIGFQYTPGRSFKKAKKIAEKIDTHIDELYSNNKWFKAKIHTLKTNGLEWIFPHLMQMITAGSIFRNEFRATRLIAKEYTGKLIISIRQENTGKSSEAKQNRLTASSSFSTIASRKNRFANNIRNFSAVRIGKEVWNSEFVYISFGTTNYELRQDYFRSIATQLIEILFRAFVDEEIAKSQIQVSKSEFKKAEERMKKESKQVETEVMMLGISGGAIQEKDDLLADLSQTEYYDGDDDDEELEGEEEEEEEEQEEEDTEFENESNEGVIAILSEITPAWIISDEWIRISEVDKDNFEYFVLPILKGLDIGVSEPPLVKGVKSVYTTEGYIISSLLTDFETGAIEYKYKRQENKKTLANKLVNNRPGLAWWMFFNVVPKWSRFLINPLRELTSANEIEGFKNRIKAKKDVKPLIVYKEVFSEQNKRISKELSDITGIESSRIEEIIKVHREFNPQTLDEIVEDITKLVKKESDKETVSNKIFKYGDEQFAKQLQKMLLEKLLMEVEKELTAKQIDKLTKKTKKKILPIDESQKIKKQVQKTIQNMKPQFIQTVVGTSIYNALKRKPFRNEIISLKNKDSSYYNDILREFKQEATNIINSQVQNENTKKIWTNYLNAIKFSFLISLHYVITTFVNAS